MAFTPGFAQVKDKVVKPLHGSSTKTCPDCGKPMDECECGNKRKSNSELSK